MPPRVGTRVVVSTTSSDGSGSGTFRCGTVRFVGETQFQKGVWVGVELDGPFGRHSGVVEGVRYFTAPERHGIFVQPSAVEPMSAAAKLGRGAPPTPPSLSAPVTDERLFVVPAARSFVFDKPNKKWSELATGPTEFYWNNNTGKFC